MAKGGFARASTSSALAVLAIQVLLLTVESTAAGRTLLQQTVFPTYCICSVKQIVRARWGPARPRTLPCRSHRSKLYAAGDHTCACQHNCFSAAGHRPQPFPGYTEAILRGLPCMQSHLHLPVHNLSYRCACSTGATQQAIAGDALDSELEQALAPAIVPLVAYLYQTPAAAQLMDTAFGNQSALVWLQLCMLLTLQCMASCGMLTRLFALLIAMKPCPVQAGVLNTAGVAVIEALSGFLAGNPVTSSAISTLADNPALKTLLSGLGMVANAVAPFEQQALVGGFVPSACRAHLPCCPCMCHAAACSITCLA